MKKLKYCLLIFLLALVIRLPGIWDPPKIVFDEVAGMTYSLHILYHRPYFDVHPPLVDMLYAYLIMPFHPSFENKILNNDHRFGYYPYIWLRILTAVAGSLVPVILMYVVWELFSHKLASLAIGLAAVFDNFLVVYSRLLLPDIWLALFGLGALALAVTRRKFAGKFLGLGILLGAIVAVKWTGLGFWLVTLGFLIFRKEFKNAVFATLIGFTVYTSIWIIFFMSLGPGKAFSGIKYFSEKLTYPPRNNLVEIIKYLPQHHWLMLNANNLLKQHEAASTPLFWIFGNKKIVLFTSKNQTWVMLGNLFGWWSVLAGIIYGIRMAVKNSPIKILILAYIANLLPFLFIKRVFFIYHYLPALLIGYLILGGVLTKFTSKWIKVWIIVDIVIFLLVSPITYGWPVPMWWLKFLAN